MTMRDRPIFPNWWHERELARAAKLCELLPPLMAGFGQAQNTQYQISRSLRLRSNNSAKLSRSMTAGTSPADTNNKIKTHSVWMKRGRLGVVQSFLSNNNSSSDRWWLQFDSSDRLNIFTATTGVITTQLTTTAVYRDPGAMMHIVVAVDTTQATSTDRIKVYVNGGPVTSFSTSTYPAQNSISASVWTPGGGTWINSIGVEPANADYFDGLLAEVISIDGQQLLPTSFGAFDAATGVWRPIAYAGTYGATGFKTDFSDNSAATASAIGKDTSGNGNDFTPTGISVTAGATNDSLVDTPTNYGTDTGLGGEVRGNYATLNPLNHSGTLTIRNGNLEAFATTAGWNSVASSIAAPITGNWWIEFTMTAVAPTAVIIGVADVTAALPTYPGNVTGIGYQSTGARYVNGTLTSSWGATYTNGDLIGLQINNGSVYFYKLVGGVWTLQGGGAAASGISADLLVVVGLFDASSSDVFVNFGQRPWAATPPSGAKALCTQNLSSTTVALPSTFTGNANADGPFVWANGVVTAVTINGNVATRGTHFDAVAGGIKLRTSSSSYNASGSNTVTAYTAGDAFKNARAQVN